MKAANTRQAHSARLMATQTARKMRRPNGNYNSTTYQWGVVAAVNDGPTPTYDVYLDAAQPGALTQSIKAVEGAFPNVGDVVHVQRGVLNGRTSRIIIGRLRGSASPFPVNLGGLDTQGRFTDSVGTLWGCVDQPQANLGASGHWALSQNGHIFFNSAGQWTQII